MSPPSLGAPAPPVPDGAPTEAPEERASQPGAAGIAPWGGRAGCIGYVAKMFPRISETFILEEILALRRRGVPVKIYSLLPPVRDARMHPEAAALLPDVEILPGGDRIDLRMALADLLRCMRVRPSGTAKLVLRAMLRPGERSFRRLARGAALAVRMRRDRVAHLHAAWAHAPASAARIASRLTGIPWSMGAHAKDIHLSDPDSLAKKVAAARFTIACSAANHDLLAALAPRDQSGNREGELLLIHHGVDAGYFTPKSRRVLGAHDATATPVILSVGRLVPKKGFDYLLQAAARLKQRGLAFRLQIVGDGPQRRHLEETIERLGLREEVVLRGMLVRHKVRAALRRATCFVLACRVAEDGDRDGIPNTVAEAMASGLPVVATRLPGIEEIVRDGENGLLVPPDDPEALADALASLLGDRERAGRLGERARTHIAEAFDARPAGERRARRFERALGIERVLYLSGDRGVPVRGDKGASVHVRSVVDALGALGVEARILTTRAGPAEGPAVAAAVVETRSEGAWRASVERWARWTRGGPALERALLRLLDNLWLCATARRLTATWRPDVIYERYALTSFAGAWLASFLRVPFVLEVNAPLAREEAAYRGLRLGALARWAEGWLFRRADRLVVVSWALYDHALRLGARHERILVLPNAVDPERFRAPGDGEGVRRRMDLDGRFVVGFCGSLKPWHGVHHLLTAAARAASEAPELTLLIVGDGPQRGELERQANDLGLTPRVRFAGSVPHEAVPDYLAACDVLTAPYEPMEGFYFSPLKVAEYLASGRPVVASAVGELRHALGGEPSVTLAPPGDADALGRILARHACQGSRARVQAPRSRVWTWNDVVRRTLAAAEQDRRRLWSWDDRPEAVMACVLEEFPGTAGLARLLALERLGARLVVFAASVAREAQPPRTLECLGASVRVVTGAGGVGAITLAVSQARCLVRAPRAYLGRLLRALRRGGLSRFAMAAWIAEQARANGTACFLAGADTDARLTADAAALAEIPQEANPPTIGGSPPGRPT